MAGAERIVRAFAAIKKTARPAGLPQLLEKITAAAREQFVHVALVRDVENELIFRGGEHPMQRERELDDAEVRPDVPAIARGDGDELFANFLGKLPELDRGKRFHLRRPADGREQ